MKRLHPFTLPRLPAGVARPAYPRAGLQAGIVRLGLGAFARAPLAVDTETAIEATHDLRRGCIGVSLRQPATHGVPRPRAGLYTVTTRDADAQGQGAPREALRVIGNLIDVPVVPEIAQAVIERNARLEPRSAIGLVVRGLQRRRASGTGPLTLLSKYNLPANGRMPRGLVPAFAGCVDPALQAWIATGCRFPNSMVDRLVPHTTDADRDRIAAHLGLRDAWPVCAEPFLDGAVEDDFAACHPRRDLGGTRIVASAQSFEKVKPRMVDGAQPALACLGHMAGWATVDAAIARAPLRAFVERLLRNEIAPTLTSIAGLALDADRARLLERFANPALQHRTLQIAMDGSQKLPQRPLCPAARAAARRRTDR